MTAAGARNNYDVFVWRFCVVWYIQAAMTCSLSASRRAGSVCKPITPSNQPFHVGFVKKRKRKRSVLSRQARDGARTRTGSAVVFDLHYIANRPHHRLNRRLEEQQHYVPRLSHAQDRQGDLYEVPRQRRRRVKRGAKRSRVSPPFPCEKRSLAKTGSGQIKRNETDRKRRNVPCRRTRTS